LPEFGDREDLVPAMKTSRKKKSPDNKRFPYITNAGFDIAGDTLNHLYPGLKPRNIP